MKICPQCKQNYSDDSLNFCLADGTNLVSLSDSLEETKVIKNLPFNPQTPQITQNRKKPLFVYLSFGLFGLLLISVVVVWIRFDSQDNSSITKNDDSTIKISKSPNTQQNNASNLSENKLTGEQTRLIEGKWNGKFGDRPAVLLLKHIENNKFYGTMSKGSFIIAMDIYFDFETGQVILKETNVIKGTGWGKLGKSNGTISDNHKQIRGGGRDEYGNAYSWSFRKQ